MAAVERWDAGTKLLSQDSILERNSNLGFGEQLITSVSRGLCSLKQQQLGHLLGDITLKPALGGAMTTITPVL